MKDLTPITQQELEMLVQESEQIASSWRNYLQFKEDRQGLFDSVLALEGSN